MIFSFSLSSQTFHTPSLGDEEFEIPPITPPPETESGLGLSEVDTPFPVMPEPPAQHRGPVIPQFPPQSLDLPSITISRNMMEQEGVSLNNGLPVVRITMLIHLEQINSPVNGHRFFSFIVCGTQMLFYADCDQHTAPCTTFCVFACTLSFDICLCWMKWIWFCHINIIYAPSLGQFMRGRVNKSIFL